MSTTTFRPAAASTPTDSDPSADALLHRVRNPRSNRTTCPECGQSVGPGHVCAPKALPALPVRRPGAALDDAALSSAATDALRRLEIDLAWELRDRQPLDEYNAWASEVAA